MAITQLTLASLSSFLFTDTAQAATAVAVKASSASVSYIDCDNAANAAATYVKLWNTAAASVTVGTTAPDFIVFCPASTRIAVVLPVALVFGTALSVASVTTAGTAGTTPPTTPITVRISYT